MTLIENKSVMQEKYLQPHNIFGELSFEEYCNRIPEFFFKQEVPEDVIKNFQVIEKMMALSFYEYRLIDEAYSKAIYSFEMAMRIRYNDFYGNGKKKHGFNHLITKLYEQKLFETELGNLKHLKDIRNHYAHPERHSFGGMIFWNRIEYLTRLINEMYEDLNLRKERFNLFKQFIEKMRSSKLDQCVVIKIREEKTILYNLKLLFINNKLPDHTYLFACTPLFDLKIDNGSVKVPLIFKSKLVKPYFDKNNLIGVSYTANEKITFSSINKHPELLLHYEKWFNEYIKKEIYMHFVGSSDFNLPQILVPEIREFQKM